jgi:hypothetical protein
MNPENLTIKELKALTENPTTSAEDLLQIYWTFNNWIVLANIAEHPNVSCTTLSLISFDDDCFVRAVVAENPNCPPGVLQRLSTDRASFVRSKVWRNPNTREDDLMTIKAMRWMDRTTKSFNFNSWIGDIRND